MINSSNKDIIGVCLFAFQSDFVVQGQLRRPKNNLYIKYAKDRIMEIKKNGFNNIILMTDDINFFIDDNITLIDYSNIEQPSYADKITVCKEALKTYDQVIYLDSDSIIDFNKITYSDGLTFFQYWNNGQLGKYDDLHIYQNFNMKYYMAISEYCKRKKYDYQNCPLIEEKIFVIKKMANIEKFYEIYYDLKNILEINDMFFGNKPIGMAEGWAMGIAALNSGFNINNKVGTIEITHLYDKIAMHLI